MQTVQLKAYVGEDGVLRLETPVGIHDREVDVVVVLQPRQEPKPATDTPEARGWPPEFFEQTAGAWQGEPLTRAPQGDYETREELK